MREREREIINAALQLVSATVRKEETTAAARLKSACHAYLSSLPTTHSHSPQAEARDPDKSPPR